MTTFHFLYSIFYIPYSIFHIPYCILYRWVGEGGKATLVGVPDADILLEASEELRKRTTAGAGTFLVKVKAH